MKTVSMSFMLLVVVSLNAIAQGTLHRELTEGAKARLDIGGGKVYDVKYSPDGTRLVAASTNGLWLYDSAASDPVALKSDGNRFRAFAVAFSPDGRTLAATASDSFGVWDAATGELKHSHHVRKLLSLYFIRLFAFSPDVRTLAVATDGVLRLWDTETGELTHTLGGERFGYIRSLAFSPDGRTVASGHSAHGALESIADATIHLWDAATGELKDTLSEIFNLPTNMAYSPDGRTLAIGHMHTAPEFDAWGWVTLWNAATGTLRHRLGGLTPDVRHIGSIRSLTFSPDDRTLAIVRWPASNSGDKLGTVRLWDTETGEPTPTLEGHTDDVNSVTFSPDGYTLASGSSDHTVRLWNAATRENILTLEGHTDDVNSVVFSPDGGTLASGSSDGTLLLWEIISPPAPLEDGHPPFVEPLGVKPDVNRDGGVDVQDLVVVAARLGITAENLADVNGDGKVNTLDLVLVAGMADDSTDSLPMFSNGEMMLHTTQVREWLEEARRLDLADPAIPRGIEYLENLLEALIPERTALLPNFPNPFNPETWIPYQLARNSHVRISIYSSKGILVRHLDLGLQPQGFYTDKHYAAYWDGRNDGGELLASGVYVYVFRAGSFRASRRMAIVR